MSGRNLSHCLRSTSKLLHPGVWTDLTLYAKIMIIHTLQKVHIRLQGEWEKLKGSVGKAAKEIATVFGVVDLRISLSETHGEVVS